MRTEPKPAPSEIKEERPTKITGRILGVPENMLESSFEAMGPGPAPVSPFRGVPAQCRDAVCMPRAMYPVCYLNNGQHDPNPEDADEDGDGVIDGIDRCPGSKFTSSCTIDEIDLATGCFYDSDNDGLGDCEEPLPES